MIQKDKNLLLIDLSARLPYGVKCTTKANGWKAIYSICGCLDKKIFLDCPKEVEGDDEWLVQNIVPYLRPMSSMTKEEENEYINVDNRSYSCPMAYAHIPASDRIDWINAHHLDYRGLIGKGLALEAPEGMYNLNN